MDYLLLARIAKVLALLGFVLPWVTVSCSGTQLLEATGIQLMTGDAELSGPLAQGQSEFNQEDRDPAVLVIVAAVAIVLGVLASLAVKGRAAAGVLLAGAVAGMALSYVSVANMRSELVRQANQSEQAESPYFSADDQREMQRAVAAQIQIEEQEGYWLTVGALGVAGILALLVLAGAGGAPARKEEAAPPPA